MLTRDSVINYFNEFLLFWIILCKYIYMLLYLFVNYIPLFKILTLLRKTGKICTCSQGCNLIILQNRMSTPDVLIWTNYINDDSQALEHYEHFIWRNELVSILILCPV